MWIPNDSFSFFEITTSVRESLGLCAASAGCCKSAPEAEVQREKGQGHTCHRGHTGHRGHKGHTRHFFLFGTCVEHSRTGSLEF